MQFTSCPTELTLQQQKKSVLNALAPFSWAFELSIVTNLDSQGWCSETDDITMEQKSHFNQNCVLPIRTGLF